MYGRRSIARSSSLPLFTILLCVSTLEAQPIQGSLNFQDQSARVLPTVPQSTGFNMKEVECGDFDKDDDLDVAMAIAGGTFGARKNKLYRNDAGTFVEISGTGVIPQFAAADVSRHAAFRDVTGDGWLDLVIVNDSFEFNDLNELYVNQHPGDVFSHFIEEGTARGLASNWACGAISLDLDNDLDVDVFTANYGSLGQERLFLNDGSGFFNDVTATHMPSEANFSIDASTADLNGDAKIDLLISNDGDSFWIYYNDLQGQADQGPGDYRYGTGGNGGRQSLGVSKGHGALEPADFDLDTRVDIYWTNKDGATGDAILHNTGNGVDGKATFASVLPPPYLRDVGSLKSAVADLNGDGRPEVIVMTGDRPAVLRNVSLPGTIAFLDWTPTPAFPSGGALGGAHAAVFDTGGDGDLDLFVGASAGDVLLEQVPAREFTEIRLAGVLPPLIDLDPLAISGSVGRGSPDVFMAGSLGSNGHLAAVLHSDDDVSLELLLDGALVAKSDRGGAGVEEALELPLESGSWSVRVVLVGPALQGGEYLLELLARRDGPNSDSCEDAQQIGLGVVPFSNVGATTDGLAHPLCDQFGDDQVPADIWFDHLATATGTLRVTTCNTASFDTKIAVYRTRDCPATETNLLGCVEDTAGCSTFTSTVDVPIVCGEWYKIRLGGYLGAQGTGTLLLQNLSGTPCGTAFCDASDGSLASCPCGNPGAPDTGCDNAQATGGVKASLTAQDTKALEATLTGTGFPPAGSPTAIVIRANNQEALPAVFFDGVRCVGLTGFARLAATNASGGTSTHTFGHGAGAGSFYYQIWYRNTPITFCDSTAAANASSGQTITW